MDTNSSKGSSSGGGGGSGGSGGSGNTNRQQLNGQMMLKYTNVVKGILNSFIH